MSFHCIESDKVHERNQSWSSFLCHCGCTRHPILVIHISRKSLGNCLCFLIWHSHGLVHSLNWSLINKMYLHCSEKGNGLIISRNTLPEMVARLPIYEFMSFFLKRSFSSQASIRAINPILHIMFQAKPDKLLYYRIQIPKCPVHVCSGSERRVCGIWATATISYCIICTFLSSCVFL